MTPLQQIADNLAALNSDAPEVADAVIKLTNMAGGEPVAFVRWSPTHGYAWGTVHRGDSLVVNGDWRSVPLYANPQPAHPSRGVVDGWTPTANEDYDRSIHANPSAEAWAGFFVATFPGQAAQRDLMRGWFANAMMAMHDHLQSKAQAAALPAVPDGWALVPKRPTPEMLSLALSHVYGEPFWRADAKPIGTFYSGHTAAESERANIAECGPDRVKAAYAAMLAAAPKDQP